MFQYKTLTVLIIFIIRLQYVSIFTVSYNICNIIAHWHLPSHSYKMKTQPHTGHRF